MSHRLKASPKSAITALVFAAAVSAFLVPASAIAEPPASLRAQAISLRVVTSVVYTSGGQIHVDGLLANDSAQPLDFPQVSIALKGAGQPVGFTGSAYARRVGPGEQVPFGWTSPIFSADASGLSAIVSATGMAEVDPRPVILTDVGGSNAVGGGLRLYKRVFRNDSPYAVEGPTVGGWELGAGGSLIDTLFAHRWAVLQPGATIEMEYTGYVPFGLPTSVVVRCEARPLGVAPPTTTISGVPGGWSRANVTFLLTSSNPAADVYYSLGSGPVVYAAPVTVLKEGRTTVEYFSVAGAVRGPWSTTVVAIDKTAPRTGSNARSGYRGSATITLAPKDVTSGVAETRYRVDSGPWRAGTRVAVRSPGRHYLRFYSRDVAGNSESVRTASFVITR
jgi:hypothetical protein